MQKPPQTPAEHAAAAFANLLHASGEPSRLSLNGDTADAVVVSEPQTAGDRSNGRMGHMHTAEVGVLGSAIKTRPNPGDLATLDGWDCQVADEGIQEVPGGWILLLQTPQS